MKQFVQGPPLLEKQKRRNGVDVATLKLDATNAAMLGEEKREKKRGWVDTATLQLDAATAAMLEEEEKRKEKKRERTGASAP